jgi:hypothetical protein
MDNTTLETFTNNIILLGIGTTPQTATTILFPDIEKLLTMNPEMRTHLLSEWKYNDAFMETIKEHSNGKKHYVCLNFEESFTMCLLVHIFH